MQPPILILPDEECLRQAEMSKKARSTAEERSRVGKDMADRRTAKLTPERRKEIASDAAKARWAKWRKQKMKLKN